MNHHRAPDRRSRAAEALTWLLIIAASAAAALAAAGLYAALIDKQAEPIQQIISDSDQDPDSGSD